MGLPGGGTLKSDAPVETRELGQTPAPEVFEPSDPDSEVLARLGKKQVLRRNFGLLSILGLSCIILGTWEGCLTTFGAEFASGGPGGLIYQFILIWVGNLSVFVALGELVSMAPTAGGQYHWTALMAPRSMRNFLSYMTGWMTCFYWLILVAGSVYIGPVTLQGLVSLAHPDYVPQAWHVLLMSWLFITICLFFTTVVNKELPMIETISLALHILGFFGLLIPLVYLAPSQTAQEAFATYADTGYATYGLSWMTGLNGFIGAFLGADAAVHMCEEIKNPSRVVPKALGLSIVLNGVIAFGMMIALVFCSLDNDKVQEYTQEYGFAFIGTFQLVFQSTAATVGGGLVVFIMGFCSTLGGFTTASRMIWSFARDRGLPFSGYVSKVHPRYKIPIGAIMITFVIPVLLQLIGLGSSVVFNDFLSLGVVGAYSTYLICISLLLYRRLRGDILEPGDAKPGVVYSKERESFVLIWGPWRVRGWLGIANNIFSVVYLFVAWFFAFWPPATPVTPGTMLYSCVLWGATVIFSTVYYFARGRYQYKGPIVEVTTPDY